MPSPLPVVGALIVRDHRVFAARRAPHKSAGGLWEFPGGKPEPGERPEDALARELREELNIETTIGTLAARATTEVGTSLIDLSCYWATLAGVEPQHSTDHDEMAWLSADELDEVTWSPADVPMLATVRERLRGDAGASR